MKSARLLVCYSALASLVAASAPSYLFPNAAGLAPFAAARFGLFIHWGPISQWGAEISFPLVCESFPCTVQGPGGALVIKNATALAAHRNAYAALARTFNPVAFDPDALMDLAFAAGFRYLTWVGTHCDGFANWASTAATAANYSILSTPYGRDTLGPIAAAARARGMRAGVYVCPSFWNRDDYWAPAANSSFGGCCSPNYTPATSPALWDNFTAYLHEQLAELATKYTPDHFWLDSGTSNPTVDTRIEEVLPVMRSANPEVVVQVRDGGVWHDYVEAVDHSEDDAHALLGQTYIRPVGITSLWEVPGTLGEQWAYDPHAVYEDAETVVRKLIGVVAKGGNFLLNIGLDPTGVWAPDAVSVLRNMSLWMAVNGDAVRGSTPLWPYEWHESPLVGDTTLPLSQYFLQGAAPNASSTGPTYLALVNDRNAVVAPNSTIVVPVWRPGTLAAPPVSIELLTASGAVQIPFNFTQAGVSFPAASILQPVPVVLTTYRHNYSAHGAELAAARARRGREWPQVWWKAGKTKARTEVQVVESDGATARPRSLAAVAAAEGASRPRPLGSLAARRSRGATGSASLHRHRMPQLREAGVNGAAVVDNAPCATRACSIYTTAGYSTVRAEGVCYRSSLLPGNAPAVPIHLFFNDNDDNMGAPAAPNDGQTWQDVDLECWIYASAGQGPSGALLPLELWRSTALGDYWTLADPASRAEAQAGGYELVATLGYVDPAPPGGSLTPAQQEATAADYAYVLRVEW